MSLDDAFVILQYTSEKSEDVTNSGYMYRCAYVINPDELHNCPSGLSVFKGGSVPVSDRAMAVFLAERMEQHNPTSRGVIIFDKYKREKWKEILKLMKSSSSQKKTVRIATTLRQQC